MRLIDHHCAGKEKTYGKIPFDGFLELYTTKILEEIESVEQGGRNKEAGLFEDLGI